MQKKNDGPSDAVSKARDRMQILSGKGRKGKLKGGHWVTTDEGARLYISGPRPTEMGGRRSGKPARGKAVNAYGQRADGLTTSRHIKAMRDEPMGNKNTSYEVKSATLAKAAKLQGERNTKAAALRSARQATRQSAPPKPSVAVKNPADRAAKTVDRIYGRARNTGMTHELAAKGVEKALSKLGTKDVETIGRKFGAAIIKGKSATTKSVIEKIQRRKYTHNSTQYTLDGKSPTAAPAKPSVREQADQRGADRVAARDAAASRRESTLRQAREHREKRGLDAYDRGKAVETLRNKTLQGKHQTQGYTSPYDKKPKTKAEKRAYARGVRLAKANPAK